VSFLDSSNFGSKLVHEGLPMPPHGRAEVERAVKWPLEPTRSAIQAWGLQWVRTVILPEALPIQGMPGKFRHTINVHQIATVPLKLALADIHEAGLWTTLGRFGGDWEVRRITGGTLPSMHAYGLAFDFDPDFNARGKEAQDTILGGTENGRRVVEIFSSWGFKSGGTFNVPDYMHEQFATGC
jgi:hypothetical protein